MLRIGITGHRDLVNRKETRNEIAYSFCYFKELDKDLLAITSIAAGADLLFTEEAIRHNIPLQIELPFTFEDYKNDFNKHDLQKLESIVKKYRYNEAPTLKTNTKEERNNAYLAIGQKIVDLSDIVIAVWDGKDAKGKGGTGDIVNYALSKNKQIHFIKSVRKEQESDPEMTDEAQAKFNELDKLAIKYKNRRFQPAWVVGIIAGMLTATCFAIGLAFTVPEDIKFLFAVGETTFLIIAVLLLSFLAKRWKKTFLVHRRDAEYLRALIWSKNAGIPLNEIEQTSFKPDPGIIAIEKNIVGSTSKIENLENAKRITWCLAQEQIDYHQKIRIPRFKSYLEIFEKCLSFLIITFFIVAAINFTREIQEYFHKHFIPGLENWRPYLLFLSLILPPLYAALEGVKYFAEWGKNIFLSEKMIKELEENKQRILLCKDEAALVQEARRLRNILDMESSNWALSFDEKDTEFKP